MSENFIMFNFSPQAILSILDIALQADEVNHSQSLYGELFFDIMRNLESASAFRTLLC